MIRRWWHWFLAWFHLSSSAVCKLSEGMGLYDYHTVKDSENPFPWQGFIHRCRRCGKEFLT